MISKNNTLIEKNNLSHAERSTLVEVVEAIEKKIKQRGDLPYVSVTRQLEILQELSQFELGRFLVERGGLNGYWTDYVIKHPKKSRVNAESQLLTQLELFLLEQAPVCLATQERFEIFKKEIQKRLHEEIALASVPCGLSADLLDLDFSQVSHFSICGIDIDPESLFHSQQIAENRGMAAHCKFIQKDAWDLEYKQEFDLIASNGLSIYEPDHQRIIELYRRFFVALKPGGYLVTSFLTPPPLPGMQTEWNLSAINPKHLLLQKVILSDMIDCKWQVFRSEGVVRSQLLEAGFTDIDIVYDVAHIFPTVVAKKS